MDTLEQARHEADRAARHARAWLLMLETVGIAVDELRRMDFNVIAEIPAPGALHLRIRAGEPQDCAPEPAFTTVFPPSRRAAAPAAPVEPSATPLADAPADPPAAPVDTGPLPEPVAQGPASEPQPEPVAAAEPRPEPPSEPALAAAPAKAPAPAVPRPARAPKKRVLKPAAPRKAAMASGPFTEAEMQTLRDLTAEGKGATQIAAALNRTVNSVQNKLYRSRAAAAPAQPARQVAIAAPETTPQPAPAARPAEPAPRPLPAFDGPVLASDMLTDRHLGRLGNPDPWTPARDLQLAVMLGRGDKLADFCAATGIDRAAARARYHALDPDRTIESRAALLRALRRRAGTLEAAE